MRVGVEHGTGFAASGRDRKASARGYGKCFAQPNTEGPVRWTEEVLGKGENVCPQENPLIISLKYDDVCYLHLIHVFRSPLPSLIILLSAPRRVRYRCRPPIQPSRLPQVGPDTGGVRHRNEGRDCHSNGDIRGRRGQEAQE